MSTRTLPQAGMSILMRFSALRCSLCDVLSAYLIRDGVCGLTYS